MARKFLAPMALSRAAARCHSAPKAPRAPPKATASELGRDVGWTFSPEEAKSLEPQNGAKREICPKVAPLLGPHFFGPCSASAVFPILEEWFVRNPLVGVSC